LTRRALTGITGAHRGDCMLILAIPYPDIDPVALQIGPLPIRWYALAYIVGLILGWAYARRVVRNDALWGPVPRPTAESLDDLLVYAALGVVLGGRLGYVLFYNFGYYLTHPAEVLAVWNGGMSFHGGLFGAALGMIIFARRNGLPALPVADVCSAVAPIGLLLGRIANFIKPELWGRPTDVPWGIVFPDAGPLPRHPSQLYEAGLEGVALFVILALVMAAGGLRRPGLTSAIFAIGYGVARIFCEFFREPDPQLGFLFGGATMGMLLSLPLIVIGLGLLAVSLRRKASA
jgi:phosphatidylglycerol:prolipoprotein diacylglycerol transferase